MVKLGALVLVAVLGSPAAGRTADDPVTIDVTPSSCVEPCSVRLTVRVEPDAGNRALTITTDSAQVYRSSTRDLDPEGPRYHQLVLENLPAGLYEVRVLVDRAAEDDAHRMTRFQVHGNRAGFEEAPRSRGSREAAGS